MELLEYFVQLLGSFAVGFIILLVIIQIIVLITKGDDFRYHSRWNHLTSDFSFSSKKFYQLLKDELKRQNIKDIYFEEVNLRIGGIFSKKRKYLRIHKSHDLHFNICAAPLGNNFFFSWWLLYTNDIIIIILSYIPFIGPWLVKTFFTMTYYKVDVATSFMKAVHRATLSVIDEICTEQGVRLLDPEERKPELNDIFNR